MRRFVFIALTLLLSFAASAQMVSTSSIVVTREKLPDVKPGYEQSVELSYGNMFVYGDYGSSVDLNYIGGYRFGSAIFLGLGLGISYDYTGQKDFFLDGTVPAGKKLLPLNSLNIPVYAHFRGYFMKSRVSPFFALSAGARLSSSRDIHLALGEVSYTTVGLYLNPAVGVNYRLNADNSLYFTVGLRVTTHPAVTEWTALSASMTAMFNYGVDAHLGFTF